MEKKSGKQAAPKKSGKLSERLRAAGGGGGGGGGGGAREDTSKMCRYRAAVLSEAAEDESEEQMTKHWTDKYAQLNLCSDAMDWLKTQPNAKTAWATCQRGDWMLWLAGVLAGPPGSDSRPLVLAACDCAELSKPYWPTGDDRPANALSVARSWARNEGATLDDVRAAEEVAAAAVVEALGLRAARGVAREETLAKCADIVRRYYPRPPRMKARSK